MFFADTGAMPASGLLSVREVRFVGPPWHRFVSTKTTALLGGCVAAPPGVVARWWAVSAESKRWLGGERKRILVR